MKCASLHLITFSTLALLLACSATFAAEFTFAILSDAHVAVNKPEHNGRFAEALERAETFHPEFIIITGDCLENWSEENAALFKEMIAGSEVPIHTVPGNHDVGQKRTPDGEGSVSSETVERWKRAFGSDRFAFEHGDCFFAGIDNVFLASGIPEEAEQVEWFRKQVEDADGARIFVFCHYPYFLRDPGETEGGYWTVENPAKQEWIDLFRKSGVSAVWNGHLHRFNETHWKGIQFITTPATSFSCAADKGLTGFRIVRVTDDGWQHEFIDLRTEGTPPVVPFESSSLEGAGPVRP
jgi:3',5'-cyclic AMP phosphodiesterase CpdA